MGGLAPSNCDLGPRGASAPPRVRSEARLPYPVEATEVRLSEKRGGERDLSRAGR